MYHHLLRHSASVYAPQVLDSDVKKVRDQLLALMEDRQERDVAAMVAKLIPEDSRENVDGAPEAPV